MIFKHNNRVIGTLSGTLFRKNVSRKKHLFKKTNSWAIQEEVLKQLADNVRIEIFDKDTEILYVTTAKEWREGCDYFTFGSYGLQAYLPLSKFRVVQ